MAVLLTAGVAACSGGSSDSAATEDVSMTQRAPADDSGAESDGGAAGTTEGEAGAADDKPAGPASPGRQADELDLDAPAIIATGTVSLRADDVAAARLAVRKVVDGVGGRVAEQEAATDDDGDVSDARLVLRVPSRSFSGVIDALEDVAELTDSTTSERDVSAEVVDVEARLRAQRKSVARIEALLARAQSLEQIVTIESQLATRQADLDALLARQAQLADQTGESTINVYLSRAGEREEPEREDADGFLGGLKQGWDSFVDGTTAVLTVVGFAVPWLLLLAVLAVPGRMLVHRVRRRLRAQSAVDATGGGAGGAGGGAGSPGPAAS
ncbi:DUF4349 domain-containing protein [Nocardioides sp. zg-536]|uniref:DUF4349 domain-containing protein n=1 Tax=Nocardioides faecalis TaxID=2803858 RepID=A0A938Y598_9ACTN|nr:DUF4349 domain-containing protein [Nocardioides faecalis]MBM9459472.1 DUF4349 domain-containing protein [Nocardioides faecalis]QVI59426.1 DUF4349 domain-containing protein [Nocardioides faecalis]